MTDINIHTSGEQVSSEVYELNISAVDPTRRVTVLKLISGDDKIAVFLDEKDVVSFLGDLRFKIGDYLVEFQNRQAAAAGQ